MLLFLVLSPLSDFQIKIHMAEVVRFILKSHFWYSYGANNPNCLTALF